MNYVVDIYEKLAKDTIKFNNELRNKVLITKLRTIEMYVLQGQTLEGLLLLDKLIGELINE